MGIVNRLSFIPHRSSFNVHRSSFIVHRSTFIVHRLGIHPPLTPPFQEGERYARQAISHPSSYFPSFGGVRGGSSLIPHLKFGVQAHTSSNFLYLPLTSSNFLFLIISSPLYGRGVGVRLKYISLASSSVTSRGLFLSRRCTPMAAFAMPSTAEAGMPSSVMVVGMPQSIDN